MNIVTICHADDWVATHMRRFVHMTRAAMPDAKLYWLIPVVGTDNSETLDKVKSSALEYFSDVKFVRKQEMQGRLLYYDLLRAGLLDIFGLDEALYADPDTDILEDLSGLETLAPEADLLFARNVVHMPLVPDALRANDMDTSGPYVEEGFLYMRRSLKEECENVLNTCKINFSSFAPGMEMWNIVARRISSYALPVEYNVTSWGLKHFGNAKAIHFTGQYPKLLRQYVRYEHNEHGRTMIIGSEPVQYPDVKLWSKDV